MTNRSPSVLTVRELESFRREGFVRLRAAFPPALALEMQGEVWSELEDEFGIRRDDRSTWKTPLHGARRAKELPLNDRLATPRFQGAISDLLGYDDWKRPRTWGGFLVTFPAEPATRWDVPTEIWHWDGSPTAHGLLIFSFYSDVRAQGGGTSIVAGSPRLVEEFYASCTPEELAASHGQHRKRLGVWDPWLEALTGRSKEPVGDRVSVFMERATEVRGIPCRVVELTGEPGDAVFCDLRMLHATSPNCADQPRIMRTKFLFLEDPPLSK